MLISLLLKEPLTFLILASVLVISLVLHELGHGFAAYLFGDDTAKRAGRLTLNPLAHLDPLGALLLLFAGVGWARPVPISVAKLRPARLGLLAVSVAGILINLTLATVFGLLLYRLYAGDPQTVYYALVKNNPHGALGVAAIVFFYAGVINLILALFNLVPVPPLDGSRILLSALPKKYQPLVWKLDRYAMYTFLLIVADLRLNGPISRMLDYAQTIYLGMIFGG